MFVILVTEEYDHVRQRKLLTPNKRTPWNKGKLIGARPPLATKARLVDQNPITVGGANT